MEAGGKKIIIESEEMTAVMSQAEKVVDNDFTVLLFGESGVGKGVVARYIHERSTRAMGRFIVVNCGAIPETLIEAELFGYERGAFTNAFSAHKGYFEQANNGTILLDEISELPLIMQVKLLNILESKYVVRIGSEKEIPINARVIAATNRDLQPLVREGKFRLDLYYRLAVYPISIPPLRRRKDDIKALAFHFLRKNNGNGKILSDEALRKLHAYDWPGNVRELESCMVRTILASDGKELISAEDIQLEGIQWEGHEAERRALEEALTKAGGSIKHTSRLLGVHRNTVYNKVKKLSINLVGFRNSNLISRNGAKL
ncbi:MAG: sigma 54-interacting transcriptional regulator [candidate division KSB1 bacterium]|nr:sigma 54-interacting transcriptional regulator [candidate division KSB1 bacterium]MDZ7365230.1 sigma 54-interacting transcriptional regulator [candidate division KSB1 bacterium]MDZ7407257.1 sigma 54-interacting transcriptional regulator [candidate division KSB1 bacterium]